VVICHARKIDEILLIARPALRIARDELHRDQVPYLGDVGDHTGGNLHRLRGLRDLDLDSACGE
jgi:hypothetical protein